MALFEKRNPRATRRSATIMAAAGGTAGLLLGFFGIRFSEVPVWAGYSLLAFMTIGGAVAGWAAEWQVSDKTDDDQVRDDLDDDPVDAELDDDVPDN